MNGIAWGLFWWILSRGQPGLIVHYNAFLGIDVFLYMGEGVNNFLNIFLGPISGTCFLVINFVIVVLLSMFVVSYRGKSKPQNAKKAPIFLESGEISFVKTYSFGSYMILGGNIVLQTAIVVYAVAIAATNY